MDPTALALIVAAILGTGGIGAFTTYKKANREADDIATRTMIAVNSELRTELARRDREINSLRSRVAHLEDRLEAALGA